MKALCVGVGVALFACFAAAADFELEFTPQTLNRLVGNLGNPSEGGIYQPTNPLNSLGYTGCAPTGDFACAYGATGLGQTSWTIAVSLCIGPDGQPVVVPSVDPLAWQWWITDATFAITAQQQLAFSATVRYRIGSKWYRVAQTVPASMTVDLASQQLRLTVSNFKVPVRYTASGVTETLADVDVARYMSFAIPMNRQTIAAHDLEGNNRTISSRMDNASVQYLPGKILVTVDGGFY